MIGPLGDAAGDMVGCWSLSGKAAQSVSLCQGLKTAMGSNGSMVYAKGSDLVADSVLKVKLNGMMGFVIPGMKPIRVHDRNPADEESHSETTEYAKSNGVTAPLV